MSRIRPFGKITGDMELILEEMVDDHDLQKGEILAIVIDWVDKHRPGALEEYIDDGSNPIFFYGPKEQFKKIARKMK